VEGLSSIGTTKYSGGNGAVATTANGGGAGGAIRREQVCDGALAQPNGEHWRCWRMAGTAGSAPLVPQVVPEERG
jgi:hypothetical protein